MIHDRIRPAAGLSALALFVGLSSSLLAAPADIPYVGLLTSDGGALYNPAGGTVDVTASLFVDATSGSPLWGPVSLPDTPVVDGVLSFVLDGDAALGSIAGQPVNLTEVLASTDVLWLSISLDGTVLAPRQRVLSVPYAVRAGDAASVGGLPASEVAAIADVDAVTPESIGASLAGHDHDATDIVSGVLDPARIPTGTDSTKLPLAGGSMGGGVDMALYPTTNFRFEAAATAPLTCTSERVGYAFFDTAMGVLRICNGSTYVGMLPAPPADTEPDAFAFTDVVDAPLSTLITSSPVIVSGFDGPLTAMASAGATVQRNGTGGFGATASGIMPGDQLELRLTSASGNDTPTQATVMLGDTVSSPWTVTTEAAAPAGGEYLLVYGSSSTNLLGSRINLFSQQSDGSLVHVNNAGGFTGADVWRVRSNPAGTYVSFDDNSTGPWLSTVSDTALGTPFRPSGYSTSGHSSGGNSSTCWTSNGSHFAYAGNTSPYLQWWSVSGSTFSKLSSPSGIPQFGRSCSFSPDTNFLVVGHDTAPRVTLLSRSGNSLTKLTTTADQASDGYDLTWSGNSFVYHTPGSGGGAQGVYLWTRSGNSLSPGGLVATQQTPNSHRWSSVSPDGTQLMYSETVGSQTRLVLTNIQSGNGQLTQADTFTFSNSSGFRGGSWSPDGDYFLLARGANGSGISLFSVNGNNLSFVSSYEGGGGNASVTYVKKLN